MGFGEKLRASIKKADQDRQHSQNAISADRERQKKKDQDRINKARAQLTREEQALRDLAEKTGLPLMIRQAATELNGEVWSESFVYVKPLEGIFPPEYGRPDDLDLTSDKYKVSALKTKMVWGKSDPSPNYITVRIGKNGSVRFSEEENEFPILKLHWMLDPHILEKELTKAILHPHRFAPTDSGVSGY